MFHVLACLVCGAALVCMSGRAARAQDAATAPPKKTDAAAAVTLGPGLYSLAELAAALSTLEAPLHVSPRVAQRIGFVRLQNRSRDEARRLVAQAFALSETPADAPLTGSVWDRDTATYRRESDWRRTFTRYLTDEAHRIVSDWFRLASLPEEEAQAEAARREEAIPASESVAKRPDGEYTFDGERALFRAVDDANRARDVADRWWQRRDQIERLQYVSLAPLFAALLPEGYAHRSSSDFRLWMQFDSRGYRIDSLLGTDWQPTNVSGHRLVTWFFGAGDTDAEPLLGRWAAGWLQAETEASASFFESEPANATYALDNRLPSDTIAARLWQWSEVTKQDALLEVFPPLEPTFETHETLASVLRRDDAWSVQDVNGVWVVTSRLAFLARARTDGENEALLAWVRDRVSRAQSDLNETRLLPGGSPSEDTVPLSRVLRYSRAAWKDGRYTGWTWPGIGGIFDRFWHTRTHTLDSAALVGALWEMLPPEEQAVPPKRRTIPLHQLGDGAAPLVQKWYRGTGTLHASDAAFRHALEREVDVTIEPTSKNPSTLR